jgi:ribonuclease P protein component
MLRAVTTLLPALATPFPPEARLRASAEFKAVFEAGRRLNSPQLRLFALLRAEAAAPRLGVAVSKKVDKRAVGRNRIKRIMRECFRAQRPTLPPGDYVLIAQPGSKLIENGALRAQFLQLLDKARALKPVPPPGTMPPSPGSDRPTPES